eukprot:2816383-Alexandrium_andersonii.AAC.1
MQVLRGGRRCLIHRLLPARREGDAAALRRQLGEGVRGLPGPTVCRTAAHAPHAPAAGHHDRAVRGPVDAVAPRPLRAARR